jgi:hypothetical protein
MVNFLEIFKGVRHRSWSTFRRSALASFVMGGIISAAFAQGSTAFAQVPLRTGEAQGKAILVQLRAGVASADTSVCQ